MWRAASKKLQFSVHAVLLETPKSEKIPRYLQTIGTAFTIRREPSPILITNAHVVCDKNGNPFNNKRLALGVFLPSMKAAIAGIAVRFLSKKYDIAIIEASKEAADITPVEFATSNVLEMGMSIAAIGFPIPPKPKFDSKGGSLDIYKRLTTGFLSGIDVTPEFDLESKSLKHYEINMLSYPGLSGSPVFDINGAVIGINRGSLLLNDNSTAYAYVIKGEDFIKYLDEINFCYSETMIHSQL